MRRRSPILLVFLALLLASAQLHASLHALGHDVSRLHRSDAHPHEAEVCTDCVAVAALDHVGTTASLHVDAVDRGVPTYREPACPAGDCRTIDRYRSRAPPSFS